MFVISANAGTQLGKNWASVFAGVTILLFLWLIAFPAPAEAPNFPKLTGRVVDEANLLSPTQEAELSTKSETLEKATGRQFVVATVNSLNDQEIADYSYQLGRHWKLGDEQRDDGIVMVVAPNERKVWIATGYGAEGFLPDIFIGRIVRDTILPKFKVGDMPGGIIAGADAIIAQSQLPADVARQRVEQAEAERSNNTEPIDPIPVISLIILFFVVIAAVGPWGVGTLKQGGRGGGWGGRGGGFSGRSGGSFSGGGGSFGGGGAGGSW